MTNDTKFVKQGVNIMFNRLCKDEPDYTGPTYFMVSDDTTDVDWEDTEFENASDILPDVDRKLLENFVFDEVNGNLDIQGTLSVTEGNGLLIDGVGIINNDSDDKLIAKSKFDGISKTNNEIFKITLRVKGREE